jgi:hypothetical protein
LIIGVMFLRSCMDLPNAAYWWMNNKELENETSLMHREDSLLCIRRLIRFLIPICLYADVHSHTSPQKESGHFSVFWV